MTRLSSNQASMNLTSSHPFWSVNNGLPANYPSLQRNVSCDAVVVGGGITGALVAVHLAEAGGTTLLLAQREIPEFQEEFLLRQKMGIELEFYDARAVRAHSPFSRPAALFSKDGGQVDPHRLTHGLLAAGKRTGLEV